MDDLDLDKVKDYDIVISCNSYFKSEKLKDVKVDIALVGQGTDLADPELVQRIKRENAAALKKWEEGKRQFEEATNQFRYGGIAMLSNGGEMDFPRMNGPISGPGTETSDDIPAMLSDGEFVVNAKAVRGVGKLSGANKSKADQRKEGARMMYALQRAGEQAMRGRS